jgi:2-oxo-4-hydroxy-4-carboxy-5-ureidoimidazoline decarboxylase
MAEPHHTLNALSEGEAEAALLRCCGSTRWVRAMLAQRPFTSSEALHRAAESVWLVLDQPDYLEAFGHHPQIGADMEQLREKFASVTAWSSQEQAGVRRADEQTLLALRDGNLRYRERFGYVFLTCATGKSARSMLAELHTRLANEPEQELAVAAGEHEKITRIRLDKLGDSPGETR